MPLSNAQYDEIMHEYDERQLHNRHILETRRAEVLKKLPRLKEIDASVASSSVRQARLHLDGDTNALITSLILSAGIVVVNILGAYFESSFLGSAIALSITSSRM